MRANLLLAGVLAIMGVGVARSVSAQTDLYVSLDGSNQFKSVQDAINATPQSASATNPCIIHIKAGTYKELVYAQREKHFVHLVGEDATNTVLTFNLGAKTPGADGKPISTHRTASTDIDADDFTAENLTFENTATGLGQAVAVRVDGDRVVFRNCRFLGLHDTIFLNRGRQYFEGCYIAGEVDFIFGGATAFFEKCHIHSLADGYLTAASTPQDQPFGFVFSHCRITGASPGVKTYLGRPWRAYSSVTYLNTEMSGVIEPLGWNNWKDPAREKTARYAEFDSTGPGADAKARAPWARQLMMEEAKAITVEKVLGGADGWNPSK